MQRASEHARESASPGFFFLEQQIDENCAELVWREKVANFHHSDAALHVLCVYCTAVRFSVLQLSRVGRTVTAGADDVARTRIFIPRLSITRASSVALSRTNELKRIKNEEAKWKKKQKEETC